MQPVDSLRKITERVCRRLAGERIVSSETEQHDARVQCRDFFDAPKAICCCFSAPSQIANYHAQSSTKHCRIAVPLGCSVTFGETVAEGDPRAICARWKINISAFHPEQPNQQQRC